MKFLSFIFAVLITFVAFGQNRADSVNVYFSVGHSKFDPSLANNREVMNDFINKVRNAAADDVIENIVVYGYASPEGRPLANERLARNRCYSIADYISANTGVDSSFIEKRPSGIAWSELRRLVYDNPNVPYREKVLDILDNTPIWVYDSRGRIVDGRKKQLMDLGGGRPWNWMLKNLFPELRNAVAISLYCREAAESDHVTPTDTVAESIVIIDVESIESDNNSVVDDSEIIDVSVSEDHIPIHRFALKTNLLYDAVLMPNLELEWLINRNWSVSIEGGAAWWNRSYTKTYRLAYGSPEVRYHIKPRAEWHGLYIGAFAAGGAYDLCGKGHGYRGPMAMAGLSVGYMWPISRCLSLEAGIGAGYLYSRTKHYTPLDGHKVYQRTSDFHYFGPLKIKLSLAWRFYDINRARRTKTMTK